MNTFIDCPQFTTSYTPIEMFEKGIFGNAYFKRKTTDIPTIFEEELKSIGYINLLYSNTKLNFYKVESGNSLDWWLKRNLIHKDDPNGWVEWYIKFYYGRRHKDDERQIKRYNSFIRRHMGVLKNYPNSKKTKQNLLQWAWNFEDKLVYL